VAQQQLGMSDEGSLRVAVVRTRSFLMVALGSPSNKSTAETILLLKCAFYRITLLPELEEYPWKQSPLMLYGLA
jgi:hypothetical protein